MKVSFVVPCRNKASFVARTVRSVFDQTLPGIEIVLSDQGSTDGTLEILKALARDYNGPHKVRVLECPETEYKGMAGLHAHFNWLHTQIDGDIVIPTSADDLSHPMRAERTLHFFKETNASYVGHCMEYRTPSGEIEGYTAYPQKDGWISAEDNIEHMVGSSSAGAWARDLYEDLYPLAPLEACDVSVPFFGCLKRGFYYFLEPLHMYISHADPNNTGMGGVVRSAQTEEERLALTEVNNYHFITTWYAILRRLQQSGMYDNLPETINAALVRKLVECGNLWAVCRDELTLKRIPPREMRV